MMSKNIKRTALCAGFIAALSSTLLSSRFTGTASYVIAAGSTEGLCLAGGEPLPSSLALAVHAAPESIEPRLQQEQTTQEKTAGETYKNIRVFTGLPASRLMGAMQFFANSLGVDCTYCHVQDAFEKDDKLTKQTARKMYQITMLAGNEISSNKLSCYTCHLGHSKPDYSPLTERQKSRLAELQKDTRPARDVYKNVLGFQSSSAGFLMFVMERWSEMLGVDCTHCHVQDQYDKNDKPAKRTALRMSDMIGVICEELYKYPTPMNCYMCHRGKATPASFPPASQK